MKKPPDPEERRLGKAINEIPGALERNLVVHVSEVVGLLLIGGHGGRIVVLGGLGLSVIAGTGSGLLAGGGAHVGGIAAAGEELDVFSDHAQLGALLAGCLVFPGIQLKTPFYKDAAPLAEIVAGHFRLAVPEGDVHEGGFFLAFAVVSGVIAVDGKADVRDGRTLGRVAQFGVGSEVAH